jgi:membrane protein DedA with SNARE-associated domain
VDSLGKTLVVCGLVLAAVGALLWVFGRGGAGLLPGDIVVERKNVRFYFPIVTCLVVSVVLSLIAWLMRK